MKSIRNNLFGAVLMYKVSFAVNPILTTIGTGIVVSFVYSVSKIFGL
ncbi:putative membrane protein [Erwinia phage pEa_SNUABM_50]|uniref:Uncharacterized protein n=2 Tax=Eneladusvirus BF TaxID=2560751 RepID=A0A7L8ZMI4_9CAUD|nr:hypothetical protein pEaSNUABM47_00179 [Erwinia phage pEa_SNUABM_47]QOI72202.1 putative membrane protein [Erwinia phage pEa_SNUABM_50]QXO11328.1 hypothetical protein pEaSNUABM19_00182 [Erwinia phage pEa_SNUABM_19]QXO11876.1 hypothetical protein pEaSNUABM44_00180 [Erwinia phage pEa_SNUABM_44]